MFKLDPNVDANAPLSKEEVEYLKHVEEGKIIPLTLKERIGFTNNLFAGYLITLKDDDDPSEFFIKNPRKKSERSVGRPKNTGKKGEYTLLSQAIEGKKNKGNKKVGPTMLDLKALVQKEEKKVKPKVSMKDLLNF